MTTAHPIRVLTVDDHEILRGGITFLLLAFDDIELVGEARSGEEALQLCAQVQPDVVLMDVQMPGMDGVATTRAIKQAFPQVQILILTSFHTPDLVRQAMQAGAIGYLLKATSMGELAGAIHAAAAGRPTLADEATQALIQGAAPAVPAPGHDLTERQLEILRLMVTGLSNNEIAGRLALSPYTVRNHVSEILAKLGAASRAEAAVLALQAGIVPSARMRNEAELR
jgi:two-component system, NarL family, response regulator LiaR